MTTELLREAATLMTGYTTEEILEHRRLWSAALRSGDYTQTKGMLKDDAGYCCLGVACEVAIQAGVIDRFNGLESTPAPDVCDWLGLVTPLGPTAVTDESGDCGVRLTNLNDNYDFTFEDIADVIDDGLLLLAGTDQ